MLDDKTVITVRPGLGDGREAYLAKHEPALARRRIERYRREHPDSFLRARVDAAEAALVGSP